MKEIWRGMWHPGQRLLTAIRKVWRLGWVRKKTFFVATTMRLLFSKSTRGLQHAGSATHSKTRYHYGPWSEFRYSASPGDGLGSFVGLSAGNLNQYPVDINNWINCGTVPLMVFFCDHKSTDLVQFSTSKKGSSRMRMIGINNNVVI